MIRHALRRLSRARAFTLASTLTLALGIGGATAVFTMVNGVLLQPLPYDDASRLVDLSHTLVVSTVIHVDQSDATYLLYRRDNRVFDDVGAYRSASVNLGASNESRSDATQPERVNAAFTSASLFHVLHASPLIGRPLTDEDDAPGAAPVAVIGERLWKRDFAADRSILDRRVMVDGVARQVVGVMPEAFQFPNAESVMWIPSQLDPAKTKSAAFDFHGIARLRSGVSLTAATADLRRLLPRVPDVFPGRLTSSGLLQTKMQPVVRPLRDAVVGDVGRALWIVLGAVGMLLLIACANVANLFLARAEGRQRELAVRSALGAGRRALLADLSSEALLIAGVGGALGVMGAVGGVRLLKSIDAATTIPRLAAVHVDGVVLVVAVGLTLIAAVMVSVLPILRLNSGSLSSMLLGNTRSATSGRARNRARRVLVVGQVALALMLVSGAGLLARSFAHLRSVDPGFQSARAFTFRMALPDAAYPTTRDVASTLIRTIDAIGTTAGVQAVGVITKLPLDAESLQDSAVWVEDHPIPKGGIPGLHEIDFITPGYFGAMHIPLVAGRNFADSDPNGAPASGPPEVIVSAAFAERYWKGASALGKRVRMNPMDPWHTIVGVVGNVRGAGLEQPPTEEVYCPLVTLNAAGAPWSPRNLAFVVRTMGDPVSAAPAVRRAVAGIDPSLPIFRLMPVSDLVSAATARTTFTLMLLAIAAVVATTIGAVGIYGVISYLVSLRTREIGVRLALGADARDVRHLITRRAVTDALIGVLVGLVGALALSRVLGAVTFDVSPTDPATLAGAAALLLLTAIAASWMPARRAASLDPTLALRSE